MNRNIVLFAAAAFSAGGCATVPPAGPSVMALPGGASSFSQFQQDHGECGHFALASTGQTPARSAADSAMNSAVTGAAVGAAAGAMLGAASGDPAGGAALGAGAGLIAGSAAGTGAYYASAGEMQRRYDNAYVQCMYAKGHQVPLPAGYAAAPPRHAAPLPPPPPGSAPSYPPPPAPPGRF